MVYRCEKDLKLNKYKLKIKDIFFFNQFKKD